MITPRRVRRQSGFLMIILVFLLVVIAGLAVYLGTISTTSQASSAADLNAAKAYQAARAGAEWAAYWISPTPPKTSTFKTACDDTLSATGTLTLGAFTVSVVCTSAAAYTEGAASVRWYSIVSTACNTPCTAGTSTFVSRQVSLTIVN